MENLSWINDLVKAEQQMEETGLVDMSFVYDPDRVVVEQSIQFLLQLKADFVESANSFNDQKPSAMGRIKIYGIAKTHADFMLFRNGFKMIFSLKKPGQVSVRFNFIGTQFIPQANESTTNVTNLADEQIIEAKIGPFGDVNWTYQNQTFKIENMVRYYLTMFLKESAK